MSSFFNLDFQLFTKSDIGTLQSRHSFGNQRICSIESGNFSRSPFLCSLMISLRFPILIERVNQYLTLSLPIDGDVNERLVPFFDQKWSVSYLYLELQPIEYKTALPRQIYVIKLWLLPAGECPALAVQKQRPGQETFPHIIYAEMPGLT